MAAKKKTKPAKKADKKKSATKTSAPKKSEAKKEKPKLLPVGTGKLGYTVSNTFNQPLKKVWEGATKGKYLEKYFVDKVKGEFGKDKSVYWSWKEWDGAAELHVTKFEKEKGLEFTWDGMGVKYQITVRFEILKKGKITILRVHESGYQPKDMKVAFMMAEGWAEFLCYLKAYLKFGVDVWRKG